MPTYPVFIVPGPLGTRDEEIFPWRYPPRDNGIAPGMPPSPGRLNGEPDHRAISFFGRDQKTSGFALYKFSDQRAVSQTDIVPVQSETKVVSPAHNGNDEICPGMTNEAFVNEINSIKNRLINILLLETIPAVSKWDDKVKAKAIKWFGTDSKELRQILLDGYTNSVAVLRKIEGKNFIRADSIKVDPISGKDPYGCTPANISAGTVASVCPIDESHHINIYPDYCELKEVGYNSSHKLSVILHEVTHFKDTFSSLDRAYTEVASLRLVKNNPAQAQQNADSFTLFALDGVIYAQ